MTADRLIDNMSYHRSIKFFVVLCYMTIMDIKPDPVNSNFPQPTEQNKSIETSKLILGIVSSLSSYL